MATRTASPETPTLQVDACPQCGDKASKLKHVITEHRCRPVSGGTAVETFHVYECGNCSSPHEEYHHEASNVTGPTMTVHVRPEPELR